MNNKTPFNRNITAHQMVALLRNEKIKVVRVTVDEFDEMDDEIELLNGAFVSVGPYGCSFSYWCAANDKPLPSVDNAVAMYTKEVKNFDELLAEIKRHSSLL